MVYVKDRELNMKSKMIFLVAGLGLMVNIPQARCDGWFTEIAKRIQEENDRMDEVFKRVESAASNLNSIKENNTEKTLELEFNFAGFKKDEITISINDGILTVEAEKTEKEQKANKDDEKNWVYKAAGFSHKLSSINLKRYNVDLSDASKIVSTFKNGILKLSFPKNKNAKTGIKIEISDSNDETENGK